jgi:CRP-like cAMP-binding protein
VPRGDDHRRAQPRRHHRNRHLRSLLLSDPTPHRATVADLEDIGLFGALDDSILATLAERLHIEALDGGTVVFEAGERGRTLFVILEGELELVKKSKRGRPVPVTILGPGDWFGELSLLDVMPRAVTARTRQPCRLLTLTSSDLDALYRQDLKAYALLVMNLARQLSRKLRVAETILADTVTSVMDPDDDGT